MAGRRGGRVSDAMVAYFMPLSDVATLNLWPETSRIIAMAQDLRAGGGLTR